MNFIERNEVIIAPNLAYFIEHRITSRQKILYYGKCSLKYDLWCLGI